MPFSPIAAACHEIADAIQTVPGLRVEIGVGRNISPPAVIVSPPRLTWGGYGQHGLPQTAQWVVYFIVNFNEFAIDVILDQIAAITAAVELHTRGVVLSAGPTSYPSTQGPLPAYGVTVQMEVI